MATQLTANHARQSLTAHVEAKGLEIAAKYGPRIGWDELGRIMEDRSCVRYPCTLDFDASGLQAGEFAYAEQNGEHPKDGFTLHIHPIYSTRPAMIPHLALYHLVAVNYGEFASPDDAEAFASSALGMDRESYYQSLCVLADELSADSGPGCPPAGVHPSGCSCGG